MAESLDILKYQDPGIVGLCVNLPPPEFLVTIAGEDTNNPIAVIKPDGTVIVNRLGADEEAAKIFWNAIQVCGKSLVQQRDEAEEKVARVKAWLREWEECRPEDCYDVRSACVDIAFAIGLVEKE